ncbi:pyrroline-5-carboxylate reductase [Erythrobacteraceae bacterium CFH 75059]|nr:pyrroline-5-carboxylate reductase [Erythrobacteraceae bacterium CFH 75059]
MLVVGYGVMAQAMVAGWLRAGVPAGALRLFNPRPKPAPEGVSLSTSLPKGPQRWLLLACKPQHLPDVAALLRPCIGPRTVVLSVLAGVDLDALKTATPGAAGWVRMMPNLAAALGASPVALASSPLSPADGAVVDRLASMLGSAVWLDGEDRFDLVTALAGSGPGLVFAIMAALADAAEANGLERAVADRLTRDMVVGAAALAARSEDALPLLAARVASKGGMTQAGLDVLEARGLAETIREALTAIRDSGAQLRRAAAGDQGRAPAGFA